MKGISRNLLLLATTIQKAIVSTVAWTLFGRREGPASKILLIRTSRFGDFINAMPAFAAIRDKFPSAEIVAIIIPSTDTTPEARTPDTSYTELLEPGIVDRFVVVRFERALDWNAISKIRALVREFNPHITMVLPFSGERLLNRLRKLLFLNLAGIRYNVFGLKIQTGTLGFMKHAQREAGLIQHQVYGPLSALTEVEGSTYPCQIRFPVSRDTQAAEYTDSIWAAAGFKNKSVVALFPGGTFEHKRWPEEDFRDLCKRLIEDERIGVAVLGGSGEADLAKALCAGFPPRVLNLAGSLDFRQLAEVLRRCVVFVGNDSGPAHLAAAVGCPAVTLFSAIEFPGMWEPWDSRHLAIRKHVPCENCFSYYRCPTGTRECMRLIKPEEVYVSVWAQLTGKLGQPLSRISDLRS